MTNQYAPPKAALADVSPGGGSITKPMTDALGGTKGWVKLIAILLFIGSGFMVLGGIGMMLGGAAMGAAGKSGAIAGLGIVYIALALLYIFPGLYLMKYSSAISRLLLTGQATEMESALEYQRKFWKFTGIVALIMLVIMAIGIVAAILLPAMMMSR